jgi:hypothetical protein
MAQNKKSWNEKLEKGTKKPQNLFYGLSIFYILFSIL